MNSINFKKVAIILAGGVGSRFENKIPKQYVLINNKKIIDYTIEKFINLVDEIVIVCDLKYKNLFSNYHVVNSGSQRYESLHNAMTYVNKKFGPKSLVITHDSARPLICREDIKTLLRCCKLNYVTTLAKKATSTYYYNNKNLNREKLYEILTPQIIFTKTYFKHLKLNSSCTDLTSYAKLNNLQIEFVFTNKQNIKITYPSDLDYVKFYLGE